MMVKNNKVICSRSSSSCSSTPNNEEEEEEEEEEELLLLPEDLILEIFTHLPPISLIRFKSLSKTLHSLISNPDILGRNAIHHQFRLQDDDPSPPPPCILLKRQDLSGDSKILIHPPPPGPHADGDDHQHYGYSSSTQLLQNLIDYRPEHDQVPSQGKEKVKFTVIDSCNGLLLYLNCVRHDNPPGGKCIWYVCNPITKDYIKLPPLIEEEVGFKIRQYSSASLVVFDPSLSLTYKVVIWLECTYNNNNNHHLLQQKHYRLYVYSSETKSWKLSVLLNNYDNNIPAVLRNQFSFEYRAVLLSGILYWSTLCSSMKDGSLCYDVEKNLVWTLKFPKMPVEYAHHALFYFGVCGGGLRLIEKYYKPHGERVNLFPSIFDVMEMNQLQLQQQQQQQQRLQNQDDSDDGESLWTVKYRVNIGEEGYYPNLIREKSMFGVFILDLHKKAGGDEEEEVLLLCINDTLIISFNLSNNTFGKELRNGPRLTDRFFGFTDVLRYSITLFPLLH